MIDNEEKQLLELAEKFSSGGLTPEYGITEPEVKRITKYLGWDEEIQARMAESKAGWEETVGGIVDNYREQPFSDYCDSYTAVQILMILVLSGQTSY